MADSRLLNFITTKRWAHQQQKKRTREEKQQQQQQLRNEQMMTRRKKTMLISSGKLANEHIAESDERKQKYGQNDDSTQEREKQQHRRLIRMSERTGYISFTNIFVESICGPPGRKNETNQLRWFKTCVSSWPSSVCCVFRLFRLLSFFLFSCFGNWLSCSHHKKTHSNCLCSSLSTNYINKISSDIKIKLYFNFQECICFGTYSLKNPSDFYADAIYLILAPKIELSFVCNIRKILNLFSPSVNLERSTKYQRTK